MIKRLILAAALAATPLVAGADRPPQYFGFNGGWFEVETDAPFEADSDFVNLRLGYELGRFLAFEARFGMDTGRASVGGTNLDTRQGAVFARLNLPLEGVDVYVLGGAGRISFNDGTGRQREEWPAAGLGIELYGSERTAVVFEAVRYEDEDDDGDYKAYTLGFKHHFDWPRLRR